MTPPARAALVLVSALVGLGGCFLDRTGGAGDGSLPELDAAGLDAGTTDAGTTDAGARDAALDASAPPVDAFAGDDGAAPVDAFVPADAFVPPVDAGPPDAGCVDDAPSGALLVIARPAGTITLDGDHSDWLGAEWVSIAAPGDWIGGGSPNAADISARLAFRWAPDALYMAVEVTDDEHTNARSGNNLWRGDCVQAAFDVADNGGGGYDSTDDFEYGFALTSGVVGRHRWQAPSGATAAMDQVRIVRSASTTRYEVRFEPSDLGLGAMNRGRTMGFAWLVNEDDGSGDRQGYIEWATGIGSGKNPGNFGALYLAGPACGRGPAVAGR